MQLVECRFIIPLPPFIQDLDRLVDDRSKRAPVVLRAELDALCGTAVLLPDILQVAARLIAWPKAKDRRSATRIRSPVAKPVARDALVRIVEDTQRFYSSLYRRLVWRWHTAVDCMQRPAAERVAAVPFVAAGEIYADHQLYLINIAPVQRRLHFIDLIDFAWADP